MLESLRPIHIYSPGPRYDAVEVKRVRDELYPENGNGQAWIHPGFSELKCIFPEETCRAYYDRVRQKMKESFPLLLFVDHTVREQTLAFLKNFPFETRIAIEVPTEEGIATPWWGERMPARSAWYRLSGIINSLGFSTIHIMGELGYWGYGTTQEGCVYGARNAFQLLGFSAVAIDDLIFPGGDI